MRSVVAQHKEPQLAPTSTGSSSGESPDSAIGHAIRTGCASFATIAFTSKSCSVVRCSSSIKGRVHVGRDAPYAYPWGRGTPFPAMVAEPGGAMIFRPELAETVVTGENRRAAAVLRRLSLAVVERWLRAAAVQRVCGQAGSPKERDRPRGDRECSPQAAWHALGRRAEAAAEETIRLAELLEEELRIACQACPPPIPLALNAWDATMADRFMHAILDLRHPGWEGE